MLEDSLLFTNRIKPARFRNVLTSFAVIATENMSFSQLPEELVDSIADYLENGAIFLVELGTEPLLTQKSCQIDESRSLLSLCLVSHRTLPSARRALYRRPFVVYDVIGIEGLTWEVALSLLAALQSNHNLLGRLVRETREVDEWLNDLIQDLRRSSVSVHRAGKQATRWYLDVLRACPNLHSVHLRCSTLDELHDLLHLVKLLPPVIPSLPSRLSLSTDALAVSAIRDLYFGSAYEGTDADNDLHLAILEALSIAPLTSLNSLTLDYPRCRFAAEVDGALSQLSFPIKRLAISTRGSQILTYLRFFPQDPSTLECVQLSGRTRQNHQDLLAISKLATPNLETLDFSDDQRADTVRLSNYFSATTVSQIPLEAFHSFPRLTSLMLGQVHGLSHNLLVNLVQSCPLLVRINGVASRWTADSNPHSQDPEEVFPRSQILAVLQQFRHLVWFYPGILPSTDRKEYKGFAKAVKKLGIGFAYDVCKEEV